MLELAAPGKTFLLGEYYVTQNGEAYVITTEPKFQLQYESGPFSLNNVHQDSPAGKFILNNMSFFANFSLTFIDPYQQMGGFGASTAQFLLVYQLHSRLCNFQQIIKKRALLNSYLHYAWNGQGIEPSGADLLAQTVEGLCYVNKDTLEVTPFEWPFTNLEFHIIHTNNKLATHTHLLSLKKINTSKLKTIFNDAKHAIDGKNSEDFCKAINQYHNALKELNVVAENTLAIIENLRNQNEILAAKGCGAMGADTLILITAKGQSNLIKKRCKEYNLIYSISG